MCFSTQARQNEKTNERKLNEITLGDIDVYRVFKGEVGFSIDVITEGGVYGDLMQVVTPSTQLRMQDYGVLVLQEDAERSFSSLTMNFYRINERSGFVFGLQQTDEREVLYDLIARSIGTGTIELRRIPLDLSVKYAKSALFSWLRCTGNGIRTIFSAF